MCHAVPTTAHSRLRTSRGAWGAQRAARCMPRAQKARAAAGEEATAEREATMAPAQPRLIARDAANGRLQRRRVLVGLAGAASAAAAAGGAPQPASALTEREWQALVKSGKLSSPAYNVLAHQDTERPFTSALNSEKRVGTFQCAACDTPLFMSSKKFDSGTGWPSFYDKLEGVELEQDNLMDRVMLMRKEVHCKNCKGHLGHVFEDGWVYNGAAPTGLRYCINGVSLAFAPDAGQPEQAPATSATSEFGRVPING